MTDLLIDALMLGATLALVVLALLLANRIFPDVAVASDDHHRFQRQLLKSLILVLGVIAVIIELPIGEATRGQLLGLLGLVISAIIALSSSSFVANAMAGIMLRSVGNFRPGDFVRVHEHFGRVTERGLFHTEIQTQDRDLTTLPNMFLVSNPVTVVHATGTIVSAVVSLGYEVHHSQVKKALLAALEQAELTDGFVRIDDLLDHAVVYRAAGFLGDSKKILLARSRLREAMLDCLHLDGVEVASPNLVHHRQVSDAAIAPQANLAAAVTSDQAPDALIFDKAEKAARLEDLKAMRESIAAELGAVSQAGGDQAKARVDGLQAKLDRLDAQIARRVEQDRD